MKLHPLLRNKFVWLTVILLVFAAAAGWWWKRPKAADGFDYVRVERGDIRVLLQETGNLAAEHRLSVMPPIDGRVDSIEVAEGQDVEQGKILAWISSSERAAVMDAARAKGEQEIKFWEQVYKAAPLLAPLDGHIIAIPVVPGQVVGKSQTIFVMSDRIILHANVDETDLNHVSLGQRVEFTLSGFSDKTRLSGRVFLIAYDATNVNNVTTYLVKIAIDNPPDYLRSGLTADVYFVLGEARDVLKVPTEFISFDHTVLVATADKNKPEKRKIETGVSDSGSTEVTRGLVENDWVARPKFNMKGAHQGFSFGPKFDNTKRNQNPGGGAGGGGRPPR